MTQNPSTPTYRPRPTAEVASRADLLRVLRSQVRTGRYSAEADQVAEQLVAWFTGIPA